MKKTERGKTTEYLNLKYTKVLEDHGLKQDPVIKRGSMIDRATKYYIDNVINKEK